MAKQVDYLGSGISQMYLSFAPHTPSIDIFPEKVYRIPEASTMSTAHSAWQFRMPGRTRNASLIHMLNFNPKILIWLIAVLQLMNSSEQKTNIFSNSNWISFEWVIDNSVPYVTHSPWAHTDINTKSALCITRHGDIKCRKYTAICSFFLQK